MKELKVGDEFYVAEVALKGHDLGVYGEPCDSSEEANTNLESWLSGLTEFELQYATGWVRKYRVLHIVDGEISAVTVD